MQIYNIYLKWAKECKKRQELGLKKFSTLNRIVYLCTKIENTNF